MVSLQVAGMTCGGCAASVTKALQRVDRNAEVDVDLASGQVKVHSSANLAALKSAVADAGFEVTQARTLD